MRVGSGDEGDVGRIADSLGSMSTWACDLTVRVLPSACTTRRVGPASSIRLASAAAAVTTESAIDFASCGEGPEAVTLIETPSSGTVAVIRAARACGVASSPSSLMTASVTRRLVKRVTYALAFCWASVCDEKDSPMLEPPPAVT